jgi:hypothetical protein
VVSFLQAFFYRSIVCIYGLSHACYLGCQPQPPWFNRPNTIWRWVQQWISPLCSFLQSPISSSVVGPNIFPTTLPSNTLSAYSSPNVRGSFRQKKRGKIILSYVLMYIFRQ